jgi:5-methylthioadenosine/S-adenosylhomocysteine deaminase
MDLFEEMTIAALLHKVAADDPAATPTAAILRMATIDAARVLGIDHLVGSIEVGKRADLVAVDGPELSPRLGPWHDPLANLVYAARGRDVRAVFIDGELLVDEGVPTRLDPEAILAAGVAAARA